MAEAQWVPTDKDVRDVERMCSYWLPEKYIADILGVSLHQYRTSLVDDPRLARAQDLGKATGADRLYNTAFRVAVDQKNVNMLMFCLKSQEGWRDSDPTTVNIANFSGNLPTTEEAIKILERSQKRQLAKPVEVKPLDEDVPLSANAEKSNGN
jgi:hypothetical protein